MYNVSLLIVHVFRTRASSTGGGPVLNASFLELIELIEPAGYVTETFDVIG